MPFYSSAAKSLFTNLGKSTLLEKRLHGKIQNANKVLNDLIWTKCPKSVFYSNITYLTKNLQALCSASGNQPAKNCQLEDRTCLNSLRRFL